MTARVEASIREPEDFPREAIKYLRPLVNYARRRIRYYESTGELAPGFVHPIEVVDQALVEALRRYRELPPDSPLYPWLRRFVRRVLNNLVREARQRRREISLEQPIGGNYDSDYLMERPIRLMDVLPDPTAPIPEEIIERREFQSALASIIGHLPESWREPFLMHMVDGMSVEEIARIEGQKPEDIRYRIELARNYLKEMLTEEYEELEGSAPSEDIFSKVESMHLEDEQSRKIQQKLESATKDISKA